MTSLAKEKSGEKSEVDQDIKKKQAVRRINYALSQRNTYTYKQNTYQFKIRCFLKKVLRSMSFAVTTVFLMTWESGSLVCVREM